MRMTKHIKNLLPNLLQNQNDWKWTLLATWPDVIGDLHSKVTLEQIHNDTLVLGVYDSCWLQELYLLSPVLLAAINQKLDEPRIKQLRFKRTVRKKRKTKKDKPTQHQSTKTVTLAAHEQRLLQQLDDPELARALAAFRIRCYKESG